ncbi:hypothetical protein [Streptomyces sp. OE57]|uniref:hypothetical protein n=1 Tax=Streptomyces lacaronensis TaxID=3379885 RepID=UPI0039B73615
MVVKGFEAVGGRRAAGQIVPGAGECGGHGAGVPGLGVEADVCVDGGRRHEGVWSIGASSLASCWVTSRDDGLEENPGLRAGELRGSSLLARAPTDEFLGEFRSSKAVRNACWRA